MVFKPAPKIEKKQEAYNTELGLEEVSKGDNKGCQVSARHRKTPSFIL
jgi:hypothetical protein